MCPSKVYWSAFPVEIELMAEVTAVNLSEIHLTEVSGSVRGREA